MAARAHSREAFFVGVVYTFSIFSVSLKFFFILKELFPSCADSVNKCVWNRRGTSLPPFKSHLLEGPAVIAWNIFQDSFQQS